MENQMQSVREISVVTAEIKELCRQAENMALMYAIEIGRRLCEAKGVLEHGEWGEWLKNEVNFSQRTANNFMRLYSEYGASQLCFFQENSNSQPFANLPYSKALKLLAVPFDEREEFAESVDVENISVKELEAAIRERDAAIEEKKAAEERAEELEEKMAAVENASAQVASKEAEAEELKTKLEKVEAELLKSRTETQKAKDKLKKAISNPKIPNDKLEEIKKEASDSAKAELEAKLNSEIADIKGKLEAAEKQVADLKTNEAKTKAELEAAQKQLKTANPNVTAFKALFDNMQDTAIKLKEMLEKIRAEDETTAEKLQAALKALGASL